MKKVILLSVLLVLPLIRIYSQNSVQAPAVELYLGTEECYRSAIISMNPVGTVWAPTNLSLTLPFRIGSSQEFPLIQYTVPQNNTAPWTWSGFDLVQSSVSTRSHYGYGKYKVTVNSSTANFYLDFKDCRYGNYGSIQDPIYYGQPVDIWVKYNDEAECFYVNSDGGNVPWIGPYKNGETVNIWDIKHMGTPTHDKFEPYPPINLTINEKDENYPILNWDHDISKDDYWTGFNIYRCITLHFDDVPTNFTKIASVAANTTTYSDTQVQFGNWNYAHYKVTAINTGAESKFSDEEDASLIALLGKKGANAKNNTESKIYSYELSQNYPNPFNPATQIRYSLKNDSHVSLKVYNSLGLFVSELVNEIKPAGTYVVTFDGSNLPSGIYIYELKAGEFSSINKMMLLK